MGREPGTFFLANLAPGDYTASYQFGGESSDTVRSFTITSNQITNVSYGPPSRAFTRIVRAQHEEK